MADTTLAKQSSYKERIYLIFYKSAKYIYYNLLPYFIQKKLNKYAYRYARDKLNSDLARYLNEDFDNQPDDIKEILNYLKTNPLVMLPYEFRTKYNPKDVVVYIDDDCEMKYILHENKRMYFPQKFSSENIQDSYSSLLKEQDINSPHRYEFGRFQVKSGDIVADIGAAEGIFGLSVIENIKKLYLFENDKNWINALEMTFSPWKDKVVIINKFISDKNDQNCVTLDEFFKNEEINFIKADIEGAEIQLLNGAKDILSKHKNLTMTICTYHKQNDADDFERILKENEFNTEFSKGYVLTVWEPHLSFRRGVIRAIKS